jgi:uncharacterized protein YbjT (DUF2867 family)
MSYKSVCILGGTGFVGGHLAARLVAAGLRVRVLTRRRERHRRLLTLPTVELVETPIDSAEAIAAQLQDMDAVVNLVGILNESGGRQGGFQAVHVDLTRRAINACNLSGVRRLLHMSALHADARRGLSSYLRSKGEAEDLVHAAPDLAVTSFRPSVVFGPGDSLFNRFAALLELTPGIMPLACSGARFAPVYVGDVVEAMLRSLADTATFGQRYDLCGPEVYTLKELVSYTAEVLGLGRRIIGLGDTLSRLQARALGLVPGKPFTYDNYLSMQQDSVCSGEFPQMFGITPRGIRTVVPSYLAERHMRGRYHEYREQAGRAD